MVELKFIFLAEDPFITYSRPTSDYIQFGNESLVKIFVMT